MPLFKYRVVFKTIEKKKLRKNGTYYYLKSVLDKINFDFVVTLKK